MQIGFEVNDGSLAASVGEFWVIRAVNHVQHNRSGAKIERHEVSDPIAWMTVDRKYKPPLLDGIHAYHGTTGLAADNYVV